MQRDVRSAQVKVVLPFLLKARPVDAPAATRWTGSATGTAP